MEVGCLAPGLGKNHSPLFGNSRQPPHLGRSSPSCCHCCRDNSSPHCAGLQALPFTSCHLPTFSLRQDGGQRQLGEGSKAAELLHRESYMPTHHVILSRCVCMLDLHLPICTTQELKLILVEVGRVS